MSMYLFSCKQEVETVIERYPDGKPMMVHISQGEYDSLTYQRKVMYHSGQLTYQGQFIDGMKSGTWTWWYENGNKKDQCKYDKGFTIDTIYHWYESGQLSQVEILPASGRPDADCCNGTIIRYFENGKMKEKFTKIQGVFEGSYTTFEENGEWNTKTYKNDSLNGPTLEHNIDSAGNVVIVVGQYKSNKETGYWQWFHKDSVLWQTVTYINGKSSGLYRTYHLNGKVESEGSLSDGGYNGLVIYYDDQGQIVKKEYYVKGELVKK